MTHFYNTSRILFYASWAWRPGCWGFDFSLGPICERKLKTLSRLPGRPSLHRALKKGTGNVMWYWPHNPPSTDLHEKNGCHHRMPNTPIALIGSYTFFKTWKTHVTIKCHLAFQIVLFYVCIIFIERNGYIISSYICIAFLVKRGSLIKIKKFVYYIEISNTRIICTAFLSK